jgi:ribosomal protein S25
MAKKNTSSCAQDALTFAYQVLPADAQELVTPFLTEYVGKAITRTKGLEKLNRVEGMGIAAETIGYRINKLDKSTEKFTSLDRPVATEKGTQMYTRDVGLEDLVSHHTMAGGYSRIAGLLRGKIDSVTGKSAVPDFVARATLADMVPRLAGIPLVIHKAVVQKGAMHYSFLGIGDIGRVFINTDNADLFGMSILRSSTGTENIQFQNLAEAARRVIEEADTNPKLADSIRDALTNPIGQPADGISKANLAKAMAWTKTTEGTKVVDDLVAAMTDPKFVEAMVYEDSKMAAVTVALAKADGYKLTAQTLETVANLPNFGERLQGYGRLLLNNGMEALFGEDALVKLTPEKLNLAFAQNANALFFAHLGDESLAVIKPAMRNKKAIAEDAAKTAKTGKKTKAGRNQAKKENAADTREQVTSQVAGEMETNPLISHGEVSEEAASIARQYYLELHYGSVVGGLAKAVSAVSNISTMGKKIKTDLIGIEGKRLHNAAIVTNSLRKFADSHGQDIPKFNEIFRGLQSTTDETISGFINGLSDADRQIATELNYFIDQIYGKGDFNTLVQEGIYLDEMSASLKLVGQVKQAELLKNLVDPNDSKNFWKQLELEKDDNVVEILNKYYSAIQLSMIKPALAEQAAHYFSHKADGLTRAEAIRQGYKPIAGKGGLSEFLSVGELPELFHPEIVAKLQALNHYLEYDRSFGKLQKLVGKMDSIVGVLKSSVTIWRPGHYMTSVMGNAMANTLAGVWEPRYYDLALKTMKSAKMIDDLDEGALAELAKVNIPEGYVFQNAADGVKIAIKDPKTGKAKQYTLDVEGVAKGLTAIAGVPVSARMAKDVVNTELTQGTITGKLMQNPVSQGVATFDHALARAAAARDNVFRYALGIKELETGVHNSLEEAFQAAGAKVHDFHPTVGTLTAQERKYARRAFYFYTWQKQAFFKILDLMANAPAVITMPSKLQYAIAESQGLNPASFGQPFDPTQLFAAYNTNTVYGPQVQGKYGPEGVKPAITQLDVIDSYLSQFQTTPGAGLWENIGNMGNKGLIQGVFLKNANPLLRIPTELATGNKLGDQGKIVNIPEYILDQTGFAALTRFTGQTPWGQRTDYKTGEYENANRERQLINYLFGVKYTYYQSPTALDRARKERLDYFKRINQNGQ